jgi:ABC-type amino acid transport substrate-binding protein
MKRTAFALLLLLASGAHAGGRTLGVFLPYTLADGPERLKFGDDLAAELSKAVGEPVTAKNFGRLEDFTAAATKELDFAIAELWAASAVEGSLEASAFGEFGSEALGAWVLAADRKISLRALAGKRLAVPRGKKNAAAELLNNLMFQGDLPTGRFELVAVPNFESSIKALESKTVEAVLVPANRLGSLQAIFRSQPLPAAVLFVRRGVGPKNFPLPPVVAPFTSFVPNRPAELASFKKLLTKGVAKRQCFLSDAPAVVLEPGALFEPDKIQRPAPPFAQLLEVSRETPDP